MYTRVNTNLPIEKNPQKQGTGSKIMDNLPTDVTNSVNLNPFKSKIDFYYIKTSCRLQLQDKP